MVLASVDACVAACQRRRRVVDIDDLAVKLGDLSSALGSRGMPLLRCSPSSAWPHSSGPTRRRRVLTTKAPQHSMLVRREIHGGCEGAGADPLLPPSCPDGTVGTAIAASHSSVACVPACVVEPHHPGPRTPRSFLHQGLPRPAICCRRSAMPRSSRPHSAAANRPPLDMSAECEA
jgi:hypothetical protein